MPQDEKNKVLVIFSRNKINILIATNVAARGLDFENVKWSISFGHLRNPKYPFTEQVKLPEMKIIGNHYCFLSGVKPFF
jgi:hypothetical protein